MNKKQEDYIRSQGWIIQSRGQEFIKYAGLLWLAHQTKIEYLHSTPIKSDYEKNCFIFEAEIKGEKGHFKDQGDADKSNAGKGVWPHLRRMASTRAIVRVLRLYCGVGITAFEELGGSIDKTPRDKFKASEHRGLIAFLEERTPDTGIDQIEHLKRFFRMKNNPKYFVENWDFETTGRFLESIKSGELEIPGLLC